MPLLVSAYNIAKMQQASFSDSCNTLLLGTTKYAYTPWNSDGSKHGGLGDKFYSDEMSIGGIHRASLAFIEKQCDEACQFYSNT